MKKWLWVAAALAMAPLAGTGQDSAGSKKFSQAISIMIGQHHRELDVKDFRTHLLLGWEGWVTRSRVFGFYFDLSLALEKENALGMMSYGVDIRPFGKRRLDPYVQLGFTYGKNNQEDEYYAMPVTLGLGYWLGEGFGLKAQFRYQVFCKETLYNFGIGFFTRL